MAILDSQRKFTYRNASGGLSIKSLETLCEAISRLPLNGKRKFDQILKSCESLVVSENPDVASGAFGNSRGRWYEWLIALAADNYFNTRRPAHRLVPLPTISSFDCAKLYVPEISGIISDLRSKVSTAGDVALVTSNPDFVIVNANKVTRNVTGSAKSRIEQIDKLYLDIADSCELDDIVGYGAAKLSLRSDRRYQIPHEGSLFKALYRHIQTREWLIDAKGIEYYAMAGKFGAKDLEALKTVATHSIVDVGSLPQKAVDDTFVIKSEKSLQNALAQILN